MAKSLRSKREKRLKAIRRELVVPLVNQKEAAKLAAQEAALAAPKLPVRLPSSSSSHMEIVDAINENTAVHTTTTPSAAANNMDVEMAVLDGDKTNGALKPTSGIGKKSKRKFKVGKKSKRQGKNRLRKRHV
ncbi:uncharacterized protein [Rutidosis leptorrhynchoides]|uniref:uncharacterized protein n=1 Tax=Rutidosis leptorrhynchoides TaxID=125765 RepID=UPI003A98D9EB